MKSKVIFLALKKRLNSKACKKFTASAKTLSNAFGTLAHSALASALAEASELSIFKNKSQYPLQ
ncbi:hypothetical protein LUB74_004285 [Salmonella enterica]|nr:hypothetical protein [Salmonella enterica]